MRAHLVLAAGLAAVLLAPTARAEDTSPPSVTYTGPLSGLPKASFTVTARITDESKIFAQVFYRFGPGAYSKPLDMKKGKLKDLFEATVAYGGDSLEFYIEAYDELGNGPGRAGDPDKPFRVTIGEPPLVLAAPPPLVVAAPIKAAPAPIVATPVPPPAKAKPPAPAPAMAAATTAPHPSSGRVWTWVVGGTGLGLLAGGLVAGLGAKNSSDAYALALADASGSSTNTAALAAQYNASQQLNTAATVMLIAGGAMLATSIALYFIEGGSSSSAPKKVAQEKPRVSGEMIATIPHAETGPLASAP